MPPQKNQAPHQTAADTTEAVNNFMASLVHPHKAAVEALRVLMLRVHPSVREGIKWNAPSFRIDEYFATTNLRSKVGFGVVLHFGAKVRALPEGGVTISDPTGLLRWLAKDRATFEVKDVAELEAKRDAILAVLRQWVVYV